MNFYDLLQLLSSTGAQLSYQYYGIHYYCNILKAVSDFLWFYKLH